jgi:hypothetical protein
MSIFLIMILSLISISVLVVILGILEGYGLAGGVGGPLLGA